MQEIDYLEQMNEKQKLVKDLIFSLTLAGEVVATFVGAVIIGLYLDDVFSIKPVFTFTFLVLAFVQVIHLLLKAGKK